MWVASLAELGITTADPIYNLLTANGALSASLRSRCKVLSVRVISQELASACIDEQQLLNISEAKSFIREVFLMGDDQKLVHARVVAPLQTYMNFKEALDNLGNKLLGETLLYTQAHTRSAFQYAVIADKLSRRSVFDLNTYKILVQETFI